LTFDIFQQESNVDLTPDFIGLKKVSAIAGDNFQSVII